MLYDPKWQRQSDPAALTSLIAWLETMPPNGEYDWENCDGECLIGVYGAATGLGAKWHDVHSAYFERDELHIASDTPWTFGAALDRARATLASQR